MRTPLLLLVLRLFQTSAHSPASVVVSLQSSQFFEYKNVSLSCEHSGSVDWTVWRYTSSEDPVLSQCGSGWGAQTTSGGCDIKTTKASDSGVYWCESKHRESSNAVNITISDKSVILLVPPHPVTEGDNVTLGCESNSRLPAEFFKNGVSIGTESTGHMTIRNVSRSDEGGYTCLMRGTTSSPSWLLVQDDVVPPLLTVDPDSSQIFQYDPLTLSCGENSSQAGWRVVRATTFEPKLSPCGEKWGRQTSSGCSITAKTSDSATYWCESATRQRSNSANVTVHSGQVVLQVPVLPVSWGSSVTLICRTKGNNNGSADFYRDLDQVGTGPAGYMTIHHVSKAAEGEYRCQVEGHGESPPSWLYVRDADGLDPSPTDSWTASLGLTVLRYLLVPLPYVICTAVAWRSLRGHRSTGKDIPTSMAEGDEGVHDYDDVVAEVTTEHRF